MLIGRSQSKIVPDFLRPSAARNARTSSRSESVSGSRDSYIPSRSVTQSEGKSSVGKTIALTAIGAAVGVGIAALSAPLAGALILGGGIGAIAGAAIVEATSLSGVFAASLAASIVQFLIIRRLGPLH